MAKYPGWMSSLTGTYLLSHSVPITTVEKWNRQGSTVAEDHIKYGLFGALPKVTNTFFQISYPSKVNELSMF